MNSLEFSDTYPPSSLNIPPPPPAFPVFCDFLNLRPSSLSPSVMGLLDQLWDDTVAGPRPENGLGKLRKNPSFSPRSSAGKESGSGIPRSYGEDSPAEAMKVTRSIMIVKPAGLQFGSPPVSPAGSTPPQSPFSGRESFRFRRRSTLDADEKATESGSGSPSSSYNV